MFQHEAQDLKHLGEHSGIAQTSEGILLPGHHGPLIVMKTRTTLHTNKKFRK